MAAKRILHADGTVLTAHLWSAGRVKVEAEFSNEPAGLESLAGYLKKHRSKTEGWSRKGWDTRM